MVVRKLDIKPDQEEDHIQDGEHLQRNETFLRTLLNSLPFMAWMKDLNSRYVIVNQAFARACKFPDPEELQGRTDLELWPVDLALRYRKDDQTVIQKGQGKIFEEEAIGPEGRFWSETYKVPVRDTDGNTIGTAGFTRDITIRKDYEDALFNYAEILNGALEAMTDGIWVLDLEGRKIYCNQAAFDMWQISREMRQQMDDEEMQTFCVSQMRNGPALLTLMQEAVDDRTVEIQGTLEFADGRELGYYSRPIRVKEKIAGRIVFFRLLKAADSRVQ